MAESSLARKMKLKPSSCAAIVNAPENYVQDLKHDSEILDKLDGKFDWIQIFVRIKQNLIT